MKEMTLYQPGNSFFHNCDSRVKLFLMIVYAVVAFLFYNPVFPLILFIIGLLLNFMATGSYTVKNLLFKMIVIMMIFLIILHGFVNPQGKTSALFFGHILSIPYFGVYTIEGFYLGLVFWLRMSSIIFIAMLYLSTTSPGEMMNGLQKLGVPFKFCFMLSMSLQLIPISTREAKIIVSAQRARGLAEKNIIDKVKGLLPMFVPLVVSSLDRMETLSMSLESRAFGNTKHPTTLGDIKIRKIDVAILIFCIIFVIISVFIRIKYGEFNWVYQVKTWKDVFIPAR